MDLLTTIGSILGGIILFGGAVKAAPFVWTFTKNAAKLPTMVESMFQEFSPNSGTSLRDKVNELSIGQTQMIEWQSRHADEDVGIFTRLSEEATRANQRTSEVLAQSKETDTYLHTRMHDVLNRMAPLVGWSNIHDRRLTAIEKQLQMSNRGAERMSEQISQVHDEVRTGNALRLGELADDTETRRVVAKPAEDRTEAEREHLEQIPSKDAEPGETP